MKSCTIRFRVSEAEKAALEAAVAAAGMSMSEYIRSRVLDEHALAALRSIGRLQDVQLSKEGEKVWEQVSDPKSPVGKPAHHVRRQVAQENEKAPDPKVIENVQRTIDQNSELWHGLARPRRRWVCGCGQANFGEKCVRCGGGET